MTAEIFAGWRRHARRVTLWGGVIAGCVALAPRSGAQSFQEYDLKAAYLYHFVQFVEWPAAALTEVAAPFVIGVLGPDPFGSILDELVQNETILGHPLAVERFQRVQDINRCHILFVSPAEAYRLEEILPALAGRPILVVGDGEEFARRGGMVGFVNARNKVQLRINLAAARAAELNISSKLLRLAELVDEPRAGQ